MEFEYVAVIVSIIFAFGINEILSFWGNTIKQKKLLEEYVVHIIWSFISIVFIAQWWSEFYDFKANKNSIWSFTDLLITVISCLPVVLAIHVFFPSQGIAKKIKDGVAQKTSLKLFYRENKRVYFLISATVPLFITIMNISLKTGFGICEPENFIRLGTSAIFILAAFWDKAWFHNWGLLLLLGLMFASYLIFQVDELKKGNCDKSKQHQLKEDISYQNLPLLTQIIN